MDNNYKAGILYGLGAYLLWGVLPIYWKQLHHVGAVEILANRFIWSIVFVGMLIIVTGQFKSFLQEVRAIFSNWKTGIYMVLAAIMLSLNWGIFIWAVEDGRIVETSMGYYINPLLNVCFGLFIFKEKLDKLQQFAVLSACLGVAYMVYVNGYLPWVSICIPLTFALYGVLKKSLKVSPFAGTMIETVLISPLALGYLYYLAEHGHNTYTSGDFRTIAFLIGAGAVTATPIILFNASAVRIPLYLVGFIQYISPSMSLLIGIFLYGEHFTTTHAITFGFIWFGLILFTISQIKLLPKHK